MRPTAERLPRVLCCGQRLPSNCRSPLFSQLRPCVGRGFSSEIQVMRLKPDQPDPSWKDYGQLLNYFTDKLLHKERLGYRWWIQVDPSISPQYYEENYHLWFDETKFPDGQTVIPMASYSPKIERSFTINWRTWDLTISQEDYADGSLTQSRVIKIPPDWLLAMKRLRWPLLEEARKNLQIATQKMPQLGDKDLYQIAKMKVAREKDAEEARTKLMTLYL